MYVPELDYYKGFGFRPDYVYDPDDVMSIYTARRAVLIEIDDLPLHKQIKAKRIIDGLSQEQLGKIVRLPTSTISLIERGERLIMKNRWKEFEAYLYEMWFQDGVLIERFNEEAMEELDVEAQREQWKAALKDDPDLWNMVL